MYVGPLGGFCGPSLFAAGAINHYLFQYTSTITDGSQLAKCEFIDSKCQHESQKSMQHSELHKTNKFICKGFDSPRQTKLADCTWVSNELIAKLHKILMGQVGPYIIPLGLLLNNYLWKIIKKKWSTQKPINWKIFNEFQNI